MQIKSEQNISDFWVVGVNYKKTDTYVRGLFAVNNDQYSQLLSLAPSFGFSEFFVLSTCNRTEIYGFAGHPGQFADLLSDVCIGDAETFRAISYTKNGTEGITHLFQVAAGLDSQILGDYEILGQIKNAVKFAKAGGFVGPFIERLVNSVLQASKAVKTNTALSGGTVSVSFAAVQYIRQYWESLSADPNKKIVLVGTGKIGRATCRNLVDYLHTNNLTLINRTEETAAGLAKELNLRSAPMEALPEELKDAGVVLVSTNAVDPVVLAKHLEGFGDKLIIDFSVPYNVEAAAQKLRNITFVDVDMLSKIKDETLQSRAAEVPKALLIIEEHVGEFREWYNMRMHVPVLKEVKNKLKEIHIDPILLNDGDLFHAEQLAMHEEKIQKVINSLATNIRRNNTPGCHYIQAINEYIA